jgi:hypothetical protein
MNTQGDENSTPPRDDSAVSPASASASQTGPNLASEVAAAQPPPSNPSSQLVGDLGPFIPGVEERCMWIDPFADDLRLKAGAVLLGDVVDNYVTSFNILIDKSSYEEGKLKGGGYTMILMKMALGCLCRKVRVQRRWN